MRKAMVKKALRGAGALLLLTLLTACGTTQPPTETNPTEGSVAAPIWDGVWLVYWDAQAVSEVAGQQPSPKTNVVFACYYDDTGAIYTPDGLAELCEEIKALPGAHYLSVTNDVQHDDGTVAQKDPEILSLLFGSGMEDTAQALLDKVRQLGFDGLEIDFENIKELSLWQQYAEFLSLLWRRASEAGISLRVVLPFGTPVDAIPLPEGPAYTVMCYNLFGTHSGPGPKADSAFLRRAWEKFQSVPNLSYALAAGGFVWDGASKVVRAVTEQQAVSICREHGVDPVRNPDSAALAAAYQEDRETYTIVYADGITLAAWQSVLRSAAGEQVSFDLWRAGGNLPISAETIK